MSLFTFIIFPYHLFVLTPQNVELWCIQKNIHHSRIVTKQSILETGWYRSDVCKEKNNIFGLWDSKKHEYYYFDHWTKSIDGYRDKIQYKYKGGDYYSFLKNMGYATAKNYNKTLKKISY